MFPARYVLEFYPNPTARHSLSIISYCLANKNQHPYFSTEMSKGHIQMEEEEEEEEYYKRHFPG